MSSKDDKKKKALSPLQVNQLEELATLTKTYKSTCKRFGVPTYGPFLQDLAACTGEIQPLTKVVCQGSNVDHLIILSLLEGLQSYAACRGLAFLGCNFGDEALQAVVGLMQKSCGKWWTGPKIQLLEITAQQHEQPSAGELPPATKLVQPHSNLAASQPGQAPSTTSSLADTAPVSRGPPGMDGDTAVQLVQVASAEQHPPASTPTEAAVADIAPLSSDNRPILAASPAKSAQPFASAATPAAAPLPKGLKVAPPISPHSAMRQRLQQSRARVESSMQQQQVQLSDLPVAYAVSTLAQPGPMFIKSFPETSPDSSTMLPESHRTLAYSQASTAGLDGEAQLWRSATWGQGTACTFSQEALGGLARVLGMSGVQLTVLSLSHVDLGEAGMHLLCQGISRCTTLQKLTLSFCGIGVQGAAALTEAITPLQGPPGKPMLQPKLTFLDLQGNALGGEGLTRLCPGLAACITLLELNLRAVGITEQHRDAVRRFADVLSCHAGLQIVNLDGNLIGDAGAALMVTTIQARPEIWSLCVTRYISRPIMTHLIEQLAANSKLHKVKGSASKHSKKKSMK